jgi:hypothetical protein
MRLAWFTPENGGPDADTALLVRALAAGHHVDRFDARRAHEFVWRHARAPYDLCVYDLDNTPAHQFVWPYLLHYPGITRLRRLTLQNSRAEALARDDRIEDFVREFTFSHPGATPPVLPAWRRIVPAPWPMVAVPLLASRLTVVAHAATAEALAADYPGARVRAITPGVERTTGAEEEIVIAARWPVEGAPLIDALTGFATGRAVIVFDCPETADWPSLNPQDWRPRSAAPPICVAIDPRDEDHSLRLAATRLERDADLRARLGEAAEEWWQMHATVERAAAVFDEALREAATCVRPDAPAGWPPHLSEDGLTYTREVLKQFGVESPI